MGRYQDNLSPDSDLRTDTKLVMIQLSMKSIIRKRKQRHSIPLTVLRLVFLPRLTIHWSLPQSKEMTIYSQGKSSPLESMTSKFMMVTPLIVVRHRQEGNT